jgi:hypothetical protein
MKKFLGLVAVAALVGFSSLQTNAEGNDCSSWSNDDAFTYSSVSATRSFFFKELNDRRTQQKAYLVKGDVVAVRNVKTDWACALYLGNTGVQTIGWLEVKNLKNTSLTQDIVGNWTTDSGDQNLSISKSGSSYRIKGTAVFPTSGNNGAVDGALVLSRGQWRYSADPCALSVLFLNKQLLVQDNLGCGGLNVTFGGAYKRKK